jgi:uncharacterized protein (TIGR00269 family)
MATCSKCGKNAVISLSSTKISFCPSCFLTFFEKRVRKTMRVNNLLKPDDSVAVGLSGGKDSSAAATIMKSISFKAPKSKLFAITINEGVSARKGEHVKASAALCEMLDIEHHVFSFKEELGLDMDEIVARTRELKDRTSPCSYCGVFRRSLLNRKARELGATKLVTGHHLDDEAQTGLMNFIRADLSRMARMGSEVGMIKDPNFVPRIKPLRDSPENEIDLYAKLKELPLCEESCEYATDSLRNTMKEVGALLESKHPGTFYQIVRSVDELAPILRKHYSSGTEVKIGSCSQCGELTSGELCKACELREKLGI